MLPRFYVPDLQPGAALAALPAEEAAHLTRVLRLAVGDEVVVFDGRGHECRARVVAAARDRVQIEILESLTAVAEPRVPITLVQAILKGDRMDAVVRDATMMGAAAIAPVVTARTIGRQRALASGRATARWQRVAVASAKQCRRAVVPAIAEGRPWSDWLADSGAGLRLILVEPTAAAGDEPTLDFLEAHAPAALTLIVGPEGGWAPDERENADAAGCVPVTLGPLTLRADAVATVAIALARFALRDLGAPPDGNTHI